jgi:hypothetical protein
MRELKVYGGMTFQGGEQVRTIVAATSWVKAAEATGMKVAYIREYWSITGNKDEIDAAMKSPGVPIIRGLYGSSNP